MALVQVEQTDLDSISTDLGDIGTSLGQEIADLEAKVAAGTQLTAADLTGVKAGVDKLKGLEAPAPAPAPATDPSAPPATPA